MSGPARIPAASAPGARGPSGGPSFAIAFGGGGARGLAHIHVIEALDEIGVRPVAIAGSSIGAIMGAGLAAGISGKDIHAHARGILGRRGEVAARMWKARPGSLGEFVAGGIRISQFNVERILGAFLPEAIPATFEELLIPLKVTATDYFAHRTVIFSEGELISALGASAAIPAIFRPLRRDGRLLIDGGICNPVPFDLVQGAADIVIAIDVVGAPEQDGPRTPNSIDLMFGATQLMMQSITTLKLEHGRPQILIRPPVSKFRVLDFLKVDAVLEATSPIKEELKREIDRAVAAFERAA